MQVLIDGISGKEDYFYEVKYGRDAVVNGFFFANRKSIDLFLRYPVVLVIDATYKTNKYGLPLVEVVGMTNSNKSYFLCAALLATETSSEYKWFLEMMRFKCFKGFVPKVIVTDRKLALMSAITYVIPEAFNILCRWHINKNVKVELAKYYPGLSAERTDEILRLWVNVVSASRTEAEFESNFREFSDLFSFEGTASHFVDYINDTWVFNHKE